jgi:hypothetical protein
MTRARLIWFAPLAAAVAIAILISQGRLKASLQLPRLGYERREQLELVGLQDENRRLESAQLSDAERRRLEERHAEADALRARLSELQQKTAQDAENGRSPAILAKDWAYSGRSNPKAAIESVLWSASHGDIERLAELVAFSPETKTLADEFFSRLPAASQQEYGNPEKIVATLLAGSFPKDPESMQVIVARQYGDQDASVVMAVAHADGVTRTNLFRLHNAPGGWQLLIPTTVMQGYEKTLLGEQPAVESSEH